MGQALHSIENEPDNTIEISEYRLNRSMQPLQDLHTAMRNANGNETVRYVQKKEWSALPALQFM